MKVPLLDLGIHHAAIVAEMLDAIERVIRSHTFILGAEVTEFEESIAHYSGSRFAIGVSSGTDALLVSLMALGLAPGDEVVTTPYSFFATAGTVSRLGARPVFVDIDPMTYNINPGGIERAITSRTRAIIPVHLFGQCAEMTAILEVAAKHSIAVVEDAAQAIGAEYRDGRRAGTLGDLGCLSFFPSKNLGALGDAGMVLTSREDLAERVRVLRVHGSQPKYYHKLVGGNFRLDALQAAVLGVKLKHLDTWTARRVENTRRYVALFESSGIMRRAELGLPSAAYGNAGTGQTHIYNQFVVRVRSEDREPLRKHLTRCGIGTEVYYPVPFHLQECFAYLGHRVGDFPEAERAARGTLALPVYPELEEAQQEFVVQSIADYYTARG